MLHKTYKVAYKNNDSYSCADLGSRDEAILAFFNFLSSYFDLPAVNTFTFKELYSELTKLEHEDSTSDTFTFFVDPDSSFAYISLVYNEVSGLDFVNDYNNAIKDHFESMYDIDNQDRLYNL